MSEISLAESAKRVLENLGELEPALVNAGIFGPDLDLIASTSDSGKWSNEATELLRALVAGSGDETFDSAHIAGADGEVFAVSESGLSMVAVTGRFVLASLTSYDMRMALRDAAGPRTGSIGRKANSGAKKEAEEGA